jgi:hypothetical protein
MSAANLSARQSQPARQFQMLGMVAARIPIIMEVIEREVGVRPAPPPTTDPALETEPQFQPPSPPLYARKKFFLSAAERSFYEMLQQITPDHTVFAKVRLCDVVSVPSANKTWVKDLHRIQSKRLDFLICDATLAPVVAIDLEDPSPRPDDRKKSDEFVDSALSAAAVPIVRVPSKRSYALDEIRRLIFPHVHGMGPVC